MKKTILFVLLLIVTKVNAQQEPQFTMYWSNYSLYNPAASGIFSKHYVSVSGREQWVGFEGAPKSLMYFMILI